MRQSSCFLASRWRRIKHFVVVLTRRQCDERSQEYRRHVSRHVTLHEIVRFASRDSNCRCILLAVQLAVWFSLTVGTTNTSFAHFVPKRRAAAEFALHIALILSTRATTINTRHQNGCLLPSELPTHPYAVAITDVTDYSLATGKWASKGTCFMIYMDTPKAYTECLSNEITRITQKVELLKR